MSKLNELLAEKLQKSAASPISEAPAPVVYRALRAGRYALADQLESPDANGFFVTNDSEARTADLQFYESKGWLVKQED